MTCTEPVNYLATQNDLIDPITAQGRHAPQAAALRGGDVDWTYADLLDRVARIAGTLDELGIGPIAFRVAIQLTAQETMNSQVGSTREDTPHLSEQTMPHLPTGSKG